MGVVSTKLRESARGQECTLNFPCCNHNRETTVLAHLPSNVSGMGTKSDDWHAVFACSSCHDALDLRKAEDTYWFALNALWQTQRIWFDMGLLKVPVTEKRKKQSKKIMTRRPLWPASQNPEVRDGE